MIQGMANARGMLVLGMSRLKPKVLSCDPVIIAVLAARAGGVKHSEMDWPTIRWAYNHSSEEVIRA